MSMLLPAPEYAPASSVYSPDIPEPMPVQGVAPEPMLLPQEQPQQQPGSNGAMQFGQEYMSQLGAGGGGSAGSMMGLPGSAGASAMATPGVAGAMPTTLGGGSVVGPMSVPGMSVTGTSAATGAGTGAATGAGGGAGAAGGAGLLAFWPAAVVAAAGALGHYQEKQGINTWGDHIMDNGGSHSRWADEIDRLSGKWIGNNWAGGVTGDFLGAPHKMTSGRPREMWQGFKDMFSPITSIADLWS